MVPSFCWNYTIKKLSPKKYHKIIVVANKKAKLVISAF